MEGAIWIHQIWLQVNGNELEECTDQISELSASLSSVERELDTSVDVTTVTVDEKTMTFTFQTTTGGFSG